MLTDASLGFFYAFFPCFILLCFILKINTYHFHNLMIVIIKEEVNMLNSQLIKEEPAHKN